MNKYRIVLAGCGGMAEEWGSYTAGRTDAKIVGLVDINEANAVRYAKKMGLSCPIFMDTRTAIEKTAANLVYCITTPEAHRDVIVTALENGCNVFTEKPLGASWDDVMDICDAAGKTGRRVCVMQNRRFLNGIRALRDIVNSGNIGKPTGLCADFFLVPADDYWNTFRAKIAHPLLTDMAIHTFDMGRFILNNAKPVSVFCHEYQPEGSRYAGCAAAACIFTMSDGTVFTYHGNWAAQGFRTGWESQWRVNGSKGSAIWDGQNKPMFEIPMPEYEKSSGFKADRYKRVVADYSWTATLPEHQECIQEMFEALSSGRKAETDHTDNLYSIAMVFASIKSAEEGRVVLFDELFRVREST